MRRYSVIVELSKENSARFEDYMRSKHIPDVLATGCFLKADLSLSDDGRYRISYTAAGKAELDFYLAEHTERLRDAFRKEFPFEVKISREFATVIDAWDLDQS